MELYFNPGEKGIDKHHFLSIEIRQRVITDYMDCFISKPENILSMMICCDNLPFSIVESKYFNKYVKRYNHNWETVSRKKLSSEIIPRTAMKIKDFVINQLYGKEVCLAVDECTKFQKSFYSFLIYPPSEKGIVNFWDIVNSTATKSTDIANLFFMIISELKKYNIKVISYATDNCAVMKATERILQELCNYDICRISCGSHVFNGIFKELLSFDVVNMIWKNVLRYLLSTYR